MSFFREQVHNKANAMAKLDLQESMTAEEEDGLMGVDAKIPGGLYDSSNLSATAQSELLK